MDAVTYPEDKVSAFIEKNLIPLRIPFKESPELVKRFKAVWTPTVIILDSEGEEHHRFVGYLSPTDFLGQINLGIGKVEFNKERYGKAGEIFSDVARSYPESEAAEEARYWLGVSRYKEKGEPSGLIDAWTELKNLYPQSQWTKKASFIFD